MRLGLPLPRETALYGAARVDDQLTDVGHARDTRYAAAGILLSVRTPRYLRFDKNVTHDA